MAFQPQKLRKYFPLTQSNPVLILNFEEISSPDPIEILQNWS